MKKLMYLAFLGLLINCQGSANQENASQEKQEEKLKPVTELEYLEIVGGVMSEVGEHIEYHGEPIKDEAKEDIQLVKEGKCGTKNCGQVVKIVNNGTQTVKVTLYAPFKVATMESHASRLFNIDPGQTLEVGCSHFCYDGESYPFQFTVAGAEYVEE